MQTLRDVENFCREHEKLYIYGCGHKQMMVKESLEKKGFRFDGCVVSGLSFRSHSDTYILSDLSEEIRKNRRTGIVIPLSDRYFGDVLPLLYEQGIPFSQFIWVSNYVKNMMKPAPGKDEQVEEKSLNRFYSLYEDVQGLCKKDEYNLFCHRHIGDTLVLFGLKKQFETAYKAPIHYIIPINQEPLTRLYSINHYSLIDYDNYFQDAYDDNDTERERDIYRRDICERVFSALPQITHPFVAATSVKWIEDKSPKIKSFKDEWARRLGIKTDRLEIPNCPNDISDSFARRINAIGKIENMVLMLPETITLPMLPIGFWEKLANEKKTEGFTVVSNAIHEKNVIPGTDHIKMSLEELLSFGKRCHSIYAMRSGICDCFVERGHNLHVFYGDRPHQEIYYLNRCFATKDMVDEIPIQDYVL